MCGEGEAGQLWAGREEVFEPHGGKHTVLKGNMGGRWVVNPSGYTWIFFFFFLFLFYHIFFFSQRT